MEREIVTFHLPLDVEFFAAVTKVVTSYYPSAVVRAGAPDGRVRDGIPESTMAVIADPDDLVRPDSLTELLGRESFKGEKL